MTNLETLKVKAHIHADGDVYIWVKSKKCYSRIGILIPDNINGFMFMEDGDLVSAPMTNPCYKSAKKLLK